MVDGGDDDADGLGGIAYDSALLLLMSWQRKNRRTSLSRQ